MRYKFKAWDKNAKKWYDRVQVGNDSNDAHYVCHSVYDEERGWLEFDEHCGTVVQWTGLQDRAGVDIYEGDIVHRIYTSANSTNDFIGTVKYDEGQYWIIGNEEEELYEAAALFTEGEENHVIGNIHEHPHLLKGE